jgi:ADP-ribose pyrophosphatase YjhB (NUDIX family)
MPNSPFWLEQVKQIIAIAQSGQFYSKNPFETERYKNLLVLSQQLLEHYADRNFEPLNETFIEGRGYVTPKVDVRAIVFKDGKLLMVKEKIDGRWCPPGGFADVGYTPFEIAVKETHEESGLDVKPIRLLAVMDKKSHNHPPSFYYIYKIFVLCEITGGELSNSLETDDSAFFDLDHLPELSIDRITKEQLDIIMQRIQNPDMPAYCD